KVVGVDGRAQQVTVAPDPVAVLRRAAIFPVIDGDEAFLPAQLRGQPLAGDRQRFRCAPFDADEYEPGYHAIAQLVYQDLLCWRGGARQESGQVRAELRPADDQGAGEDESQPGAERPA